jgi:hypothetical protein
MEVFKKLTSHFGVWLCVSELWALSKLIKDTRLNRSRTLLGPGPMKNSVVRSPLDAPQRKSSSPSRYEHPASRESGSKLKPRLSRLAWIPSSDMDYRSWVQEGSRIGSLARASAWWIGDWLCFGTEIWGERYAKAAKITGYDPKTLRNMRYVASRFDLSLRKDNLTWSHHALLAALDSEEQRYWLDRAGSEGLSVEDLRTELRHSQRPDGQHKKSETRHFPLNSAEGIENLASRRSLLCPKCGYQIGGEEKATKL